MPSARASAVVLPLSATQWMPRSFRLRSDSSAPLLPRTHSPNFKRQPALHADLERPSPRPLSSP
eukprot:scaffold748_cov251-Pinguiococcus_pyrenoidosus.AAC.54